MSDFPASGAPSGAEASNPAFANAVQRAKEVSPDSLRTKTVLRFLFLFRSPLK